MSETHIRLAAKLYAARDAVKFLLGDLYAERMKQGGALLEKLAEKRSKGVLEVATVLAKEVEAEGRAFAALAILAAAVELLEPSTA